MNKLVQLKDKNKNNIFSVPYFPIGYIYLSTSSINPSEIFGGTWEPIKDRFLLLAGDTYTGGQTGGETTHKLTTNEMPSHNHDVIIQAYWGGAVNTNSEYYNIPNSWGTEWSNRPWMNYSSSVGGNQAHNNMPPYIVVYGWVKVNN